MTAVDRAKAIAEYMLPWEAGAVVIDFIVAQIEEAMAEEREACAKVAASLFEAMPASTIFPVTKSLVGRIVAAIRARGQR